MVNIDNGFGAGYLAGLINRRVAQAAQVAQVATVGGGAQR